jgi:hypothetical protein
MKKIKTLIVTLSLLMIGSFMQAQKNAALSEQQKGYLLNTWYQLSQESSGDILTFTLTKHVNVPGVDVTGFEYSKLVFSNATDFSVEYWTKCSANINFASGKWNYSNGSSVQLNFDSGKCKNTLTILEITNNKLKVQVK